jgi:ferredoxin
MGVRVRFLPSGRSVRIPRGMTLLSAARRAGLPVASACGAEGICGRCAVAILAGAEALPRETPFEAEVKRRNRVPTAQRLACRIAVTAPLEVTAGYW